MPRFPMALLLALVAAIPAAARPAPTPPDLPELPPVQSVTRAAAETTYFGGTVWDAADGRWEAIPGGIWTFESGVGSAINADSTRKAVGLHSLMEGWMGVDLTTPSLEVNPFHVASGCAIDGTASLWAGVPEAEARAMGWLTGQGYGNHWDYRAAKTFVTPGGGNVSFSFDYRLEAESGFDYLFAQVDTTGTGAKPLIQLGVWTGVESGSAEFTLIPGETLPSGAGAFTLVFQVVSDEAWSDEDGLFPTTCGLAALDNVTLSGRVTDMADFETGLDGWTPLDPSPGRGGEWSNLLATTDLQDPACACTFGDSVLAFIDPTARGAAHGTYQDNIAVSPWIDLRDAGGARVGKVLEYSGYENLPGYRYLFTQVRVRWLPESLPSPVQTSTSHGFHWVGINYGVDTCSCPPGWRRMDLTAVIPPDAEQFQVAIGVLNQCWTHSECYENPGESPWFDAVRVGVVDLPLPGTTFTWGGLSPHAPRDAFPPSAGPGPLISRAARFDSQVQYQGYSNDLLEIGTRYNPYPSLVDVLFRVRPGAGIDPARFNAWIGGFGTEGNWRVARMDTLERDGVLHPFNWMTAFHESDPQFVGPDTAPDPGDVAPPGQPTRLRNDMFPDDLFTPGTRVDLFYRWSSPLFGGAEAVYPDTTGGTFIEMEVLPSSLTLEGTNNRVLLVDQTSFGNPLKAVVEDALTRALPGASTNYENRAWDRFDLYTVSGLASDATPDMSLINRYDRILWIRTAGSIGQIFSPDSPDVPLLRNWLDCPGGAPGGGDGCARGLYLAGNSYYLMKSTLYLDLGLQDITNQGTATLCTTLLGDPNGAFARDDQRGLWIPGGIDGIDAVPSTADAEHLANLGYGAPLSGTASVSTTFRVRTNDTVTGYWRSVVDAFNLGNLRPASGCDGDSGDVAGRLADVLAWFDSEPPTPVSLLAFDAARTEEGVVVTWRTAGTPSDHLGFQLYRETAGDRVLADPTLLTGRTEYTIVDREAPEGVVDYWLLEHLRDGGRQWWGPATAGPRFRQLRVYPTRPNPFRGSTRIRVELPEAQPVTVGVYDIEGREAARPVDGRLEAGVHDLVWDGRDAAGRDLPQGIYLVRIRASGRVFTQKIVKAGP